MGTMYKDDLSEKQEILRRKNRERLWMFWPSLFLPLSLLLLFYLAQQVSQMIRPYLGGPLAHFSNSMAFQICSSIFFLILLFVIRWMTQRTETISKEIKDLQQEVNEIILARKLEEFAARLRSGEIKPNPNLQ